MPEKDAVLDPAGMAVVGAPLKTLQMKQALCLDEEKGK
jgi:hypothetical protein